MKSVKLQTNQNAESHYFHGLQSSDLFLRLLNNKQLAVALTDDQGNIILSNNSFIEKVLKAPVQPDFQSIIADIKKSGNDNNDHSITLHTGNRIIEFTFIKLTEEPQRTSYLWLAHHHSQSEIHRKVASLKNLYRSFIDTSFELIFRTSTDGMILFANRLFSSSFGFDQSTKAKSLPVTSLFENPEQYTLLQEKLLSDKRIDNEIVHFKKTDGSRLTARVNCHFHKNESGVPVFTWTMLNISQQLEAEDILQSRNDELDKVNNQMEKFLYSTSHDLRSPITTILGLVNLVRMESKDNVVLDYISKVEASTQKLDKIIRDIMSFSRTTYKHVASERINFEILAWKAFNTYRSNPASKKIHFEVKSNGDFPFYADSERLDIVFDNIIRNAIHFYDSNKSRPFIRVNITITNATAQIEIIDNGIGIGKQHLDHIFNMFYKATHISRGAGLGLYIVKETAEKLGATISIESEIGFGTVLRLTIPNDCKGKLIDRKLQLRAQS